MRLPTGLGAAEGSKLSAPGEGWAWRGALRPVLSKDGCPGPGASLWLCVPKPSVSEPGPAALPPAPQTLHPALLPGSTEGQLMLLNPQSLQVQASWASVSLPGQWETGLNSSPLSIDGSKPSPLP